MSKTQKPTGHRDLDAFARIIAHLREARHASLSGCPTRIATELAHLTSSPP